MLDTKFVILFRAIRHYGVLEVLKILLSSLLNMGGKRLILFSLSHPKTKTAAIEASNNYLYKFATEKNLRDVCNTLQNDPDNCPSESDIKKVIEGHARCMLQLDGNKLIGYTWVWNNHLAYIVDGFHLQLPDDTLYNYKGYTSEDYRGRGLQSSRPQQLLNLLKNEGVTRLFCYVDRTNPRSLRGIKKSGYEKVGELKVRHKSNKSAVIKLTLTDEFIADK